MRHSNIVGSSTAARRFHCPGSIDLEAEIPNPPDSPYAAEGTALHEAMEYILGHDLMPADIIGREFYGHVITPEMRDLLEYCVAAFDGVVGYADFELEKTLAFPGIEGAFGTGDVMYFDEDRAGIMDWKFGGGVPVKTPGNMQAKFLLCGMRQAYKLGPDVRLFATFVQPRMDYVETCEFTHAELDTFETDLRHAVTVRRHADNNLKSGSHCKFCKAVVICPARHEEARRAIMWKQALKDSMPEALALADAVEEWAAGVRSAAHAALEAGAEVQGWKLVDKRSAGREWLPEMTEAEIDKILYRRFRLLKSQRFASTLKSPTQIEKLVGKGKVDDLVRSRPSSGTTLVREDDKREAVNRPARTMSSLFTAINNNQKED